MFQSQDEVVEWARSTGRSKGLVIVIKSSETSGKNRRPRVRLCCERSGKYRKYVRKNVKEFKCRPRSTGTKKCECPFELNCYGDKLGWTLYARNGLHNHPSIGHLEGHSYAGRLSREETSLMVEMSKYLIKPRDIFTTLKKRDASNASTIKSIYNARQNQKVLDIAGKSRMQQLLQKLSDQKYVEWHRKNELTQCVTDLFWSHPIAGNLLRSFLIGT